MSALTVETLRDGVWTVRGTVADRTEARMLGEMFKEPADEFNRWALIGGTRYDAPASERGAERYRARVRA